MVIHFMEEHAGERQDILMRITRYHKKAVERQILESIRILGGNKNPQKVSISSLSRRRQGFLPYLSGKEPTSQETRRRIKGLGT